MGTIEIGLLGAGNVGHGVARILAEHGPSIADRVGAEVVIRRALVRDVHSPRAAGLLDGCLTADPAEILDDPAIAVVVEVMGGLSPAHEYVSRALAAGKHVVSANKALLATHGPELLDVARTQDLALRFEGAVAGGIPILRAIREGLASDEVESLTGIINGTCNFILDGMTRRGLDYPAALAQAQSLGFAEADPTFDVTGLDAAQKLVLLMVVAWGVAVAPDAVPTEGLAGVTAFDIACAQQYGFVVKLIAQAEQRGAQVFARVFPALVPAGNVLAGVHGSYNAVLVCSRALGRSLYYGRGAGMMPTGSAVVSDVIEVCRDLVAGRGPGPVGPKVATMMRTAVADDGARMQENYLRVRVPNAPGVLARVAACLGHHGVSIKRIDQDPRAPGAPVDMVVLTEAVAEAKVAAAVVEVEGLDCVTPPVVRLRVLAADPLE